MNKAYDEMVESFKSLLTDEQKKEIESEEEKDQIE